MIPSDFALWWSGSKMSYLRYLTFRSLRHFNPDSKITLFIGDKCQNDDIFWKEEEQDFENQSGIEKDYIGSLDELEVEIIHVDYFSEYPSNFQSDMFRWWYLKNHGGWYLDADQIVLRSFETLPSDNDLICSIYKAKSCGVYSPVGCIGASKDSEVVKWINKLIPQYYDKNNYNSMGPFMFLSIINMRKWEDKIFNTSHELFYPIPESYLVGDIYNGTLDLVEKSKISYSAHWFGGHKLSQKFNKIYSEEFAKTSNDSISIFLRNKKII